MENHTLSDHQAVRFSVGGARRRTENGHGVKGGWRTQYFQTNTFLAALSFGGLTAPTSSVILAPSHACDYAMPRRKPSNGKRRPKYWWNIAIKQRQTECTKACIRHLRARSVDSREELRLVYKTARSALKREIKENKRRSTYVTKLRGMCGATRTKWSWASSESHELRWKGVRLGFVPSLKSCSRSTTPRLMPYYRCSTGSSWLCVQRSYYQ
uniref:Uncharacterized protein n=1 Tax=Anopheles atroparvus TaxID=41427 RepID=A0AAG5DQC1_ANOAO